MKRRAKFVATLCVEDLVQEVLLIGCARYNNLKVIGHRILSLVISDLINEIVGVYQKHGWQLRRVLLRPESGAELAVGPSSVDGVAPEAAELDALWFSRPSHEQREAWELRLIAENPYALFETFEADEPEEEREDARREMEARMREYSTNKVMSDES